MTEEQVERFVEIETNALDRAYMAGGMTDQEYDEAIKALDAWARRQMGRVQ